MGITDKYEFDTENYGTTGWNALLATALEKADDVIHTYLRYPVGSGETISSFDPVQLFGGAWRKAQADGIKNPAHGIAIEAGTSGEYLRAQQIGPLSHPPSGEVPGWSFSGSGEIYLGPTGLLTQTVPTSNIDLVGYSIDPTTILLVPPIKQSDSSAGVYVPLSYITTSVGSPGSDVKLPSEKAVRTAIGAGGYIPLPTPPVTVNRIPKWKTVSGELQDGFDVGTAANNLVQLDGSAKLPAVDGSQLTGISSGGAAAAVVYTKSSDYTILSGELGNIFRMNNSGECTFTMPAGVSGIDGKRATIAALTGFKTNALAQGTNKMGFSATAPGVMYHNVSGECGANITLEWNNTLSSWIPVSAFGTWGIS
jgi:hypothetical protein